MPRLNIPTHPLIRSIILASAGSTRNYRISFYGQLVIGLLYSLGYFDLRIVGLIIGFIIPILWVISTYRLLKARSNQIKELPFPSWMKKDPGNALIIILDIFFLAFIWYFILGGYYDNTFIKILFTIFFPLLTLVMLKNLIIYDPEFFRKRKKEENTDKEKEENRD